MHSHLTIDDRLVIARLHNKDVSCRAIAKILGVHHTTVSRELRRNVQHGTYRAAVAQRCTAARRTAAKAAARKIENDPWLQKVVHAGLRKTLSPEQVSGRLNLQGIAVSHTTIYRYLYRSYPRGRVYLRRKGKKRRIYGTKRAKQALQEAKKVRIDQRPQWIEQRQRLGDFEGDTVILGGRKQRLYTLVDRKSGYLLMAKLVPHGSYGLSDLVRKETKKYARRHTIKSITYDNGSEFTQHRCISRDTGIPIYFAYPYHSWERGTNENTNGLIREFFPKDRHGDTISVYGIRKLIMSYP